MKIILFITLIFIFILSAFGTKDLKITIIYDNFIHQEGMEADWGFSCFIQEAGKNILFDTGGKEDLFIKNFKELKLKAEDVDLIVLSHEHWDHTGGLFAFLKLKNDLPVYFPHSFSSQLIKRIKNTGATPIRVKEPIKITNNIYLSPEMGTQIKEISLAINTNKGLAVITGCSHPGILNILREFKNYTKTHLYLALGGFHLMKKTPEEMEEIISEMNSMGLKKCGATHCTGKKQIEMFKKAFLKNYIPMGVGKVIQIKN